MNVVVIGGTRFLGIAVVRALAARGHRVMVVHRGMTKADLPEGVAEHHADVRDTQGLVAYLRDMQPEAIIDTILQADTLRALVDGMHGGLKQFVHCGSTGVYTPMRRIPAQEDDRCDPPPELGGFEHKLEQDAVLLDAHRKHGFPATILRPTNIYGRGDIPLEIWGGRNPGFFRRLVRNEPVTLPNDGRALLQPGHVAELGEAFALALDAPGSIGQVCNISSARAVELNVYLQIIKDALGSTSPVDYAPMDRILAENLPSRKVNDGGLRFVCEHMCVDVSKARRKLGFSPTITLEEGMRDNLAWMREEGIIPG